MAGATYSERIWARINKGAPEQCWEWMGSRQPRGYGRINRAAYGEELVHRFVWSLTNGPIPDGLLICHHCDNPPCCNPAHLFLGDQADNMTDMWAKGRHPQDCWQKGEECHTAKLTEAAVREIRIRYAQGGITHRELADAYQISPANVGLVIQRRIWKHVL